MFMGITTIRWQTKIFYKPSGDGNFRKAAQNSKNAPSEHLMCYSIYAVGTSHIKYYKKVEKFSAGSRCLVGFLTLLFT